MPFWSLNLNLCDKQMEILERFNHVSFHLLGIRLEVVKTL